MVIADQYFSLGAGPPTGKPTKLFFLGAGGDIFVSIHRFDSTYFTACLILMI